MAAWAFAASFHESSQRSSSGMAVRNPASTWLSVSDDPAAKVSGRYWHHREIRKPAVHVMDGTFQDRLIENLAALTGISLF